MGRSDWRHGTADAHGQVRVREGCRRPSEGPKLRRGDLRALHGGEGVPEAVGREAAISSTEGAELAKPARITREYVNKLEAGRYDPTVSGLPDVAFKGAAARAGLFARAGYVGLVVPGVMRSIL